MQQKYLLKMFPTKLKPWTIGWLTTLTQTIDACSSINRRLGSDRPRTNRPRTVRIAANINDVEGLMLSQDNYRDHKLVLMMMTMMMMIRKFVQRIVISISNALCILMQLEMVCLQWLFEWAFCIALISELIWKQIPDGRIGDREWPTA